MPVTSLESLSFRPASAGRNLLFSPGRADERSSVREARCYHSLVPPLLEVRHLTVNFPSRSPGDVRSLAAVRDLSFTVASGEVLALVGESGSGKSLTALALMRLLPPQARAAGEIWFANGASNHDLLQIPEPEIRSLRGSRMAMIFQEPMTALNPVMRMGDQIAEAITAHRRVAGTEAWKLAVEAMQEVAIPDAARRARD